MAFLAKCSRNLLKRPALAQSASRAIFFDKKQDIGPDPIDHATGNEKLLLILNEKGYDDPFMVDKSYPRGPATKDNPCLVPSFSDKKAIGCICQEDQTHVCYMWVHANENKRCECGHWFKLVPKEDFRMLAYGKIEDSPEMF